DRGDFEALAAVYNSKFAFSDWAAEEAVRVLPSDRVVPFCRTLEFGSEVWRSAVRGVKRHPKEAVIDYLKESVRRPNPWAKYACYGICMNRGWDDLTEQALSDRYDDTFLPRPNLPDNECTLGETAEIYLKCCKKK